MSFALSREDLEAASAIVRRFMPPTPEYRWPQLEAALGTELWLKHENHTPTGSFKLRGAATFIDWLTRTQPDLPGIVTATRGNHGQGQALCATAAGLRAVVYVPHGNSTEKNAAMRSFGAELIEFGADFDTSREEAARLSHKEGLFLVPPFHPELVHGVATCAFELLTAQPGIETLYVPIGCGSGICGAILARDALGLRTEIVGVVSERANTAKLSAEAGLPVETASADTFADGMAVRVPVPEALAIYGKKAARFVEVSDDEVAEAVRLCFRATHNVAEGAGAAPLAAALQERDRLRGRRVAAILCGGNIDTAKFIDILQGHTPPP